MYSRLQELYRFIDHTVEKIYTQHPAEIRCKKGCADCCHAVFDISFIEASFLAQYLHSHRKILQRQQGNAEKAAISFEQLVKSGKNPSTARIRCPLLDDNDLCLGHEVRPVNCRTYGTPTVINGKAHVCGLSGFDNNKKYSTIDLAPIQNSLKNFSVGLAGEEFGNRRFPIAWVFLRLDYFLPPDAKTR